MSGTAVVIPAFNEAATIRDIAERVLAQPVERLIVVDDGSTDGTAAALAGLDLEPLINPGNQGKGATLLRGLAHARALGYSAVITLDADGQHRPEDIPRLLEQASQSPRCIIIAARTHRREQAPALRRFANRFADFWISWACAQRVTDSQSGFRLYPAALLEQLATRASCNAGFVFESELLIDAARRGFGSVSVPIETIYDPQARRSHYRPLRDTSAIVRMVAAKLYRQGFSLSALWRSRRPLKPHPATTSAAHQRPSSRFRHEKERTGS